VCSRGEPASSALHRARTIGPSTGMLAPPPAPGMNSAQSGAPSCTASTSPVTASANTRHSGISTRRWPSRSTSRAICGAQSAAPSDPDAATAPATP
jgi:hypothetical protein